MTPHPDNGIGNVGVAEVLVEVTGLLDLLVAFNDLLHFPKSVLSENEALNLVVNNPQPSDPLCKLRVHGKRPSNPMGERRGPPRPSQPDRYVAGSVRLSFGERHFVAKALSAGPDSGQL